MQNDELTLVTESESEDKPERPSRRDKFHVDTRSGKERRVNEERRSDLRFEKNRRSGNERRQESPDVWSDNPLD